MGKRSKRARRADRRMVARLQKYEVYYVAHRFDVSVNEVRSIIRRVGNNRKKVYAALR